MELKHRIILKKLDYFQTVYGLVSLGLFNAETLHQPSVLLRCQLPGFGFRTWPLEASRLQTLVEKNESVALPVQRFHAVSASTAEEKEGIGEWIQLKLLLHDAG